MFLKLNFVLIKQMVNNDGDDTDFTLANNIDIDCLLNDYVQPAINSDTNDVRNEMLEQWNRCLELDDGYLPIHIAALDSDVIALERQCKILMERVERIDFLTEDCDETPLHLAVRNNSSVDIVEVLLKYNSSVVHQNIDGNNCLHLCALYCDNVEILNLLLPKVPFELLGVLNYDGSSVLHLAVSLNKFLFVKSIIDYIDRHLNINTPFKEINDEIALNGLLQNYLGTFIAEERPNLHLDVRKMVLLNQRNRTSGRTPLFLSINYMFENICFLLLAHGADPRAEDFSGTDCNSLSTDIINNKLISSAAYNTTQLLKCIEYRLLQEKPKLNLIKEELISPKKENLILKIETTKTKTKKRPHAAAASLNIQRKKIKN